MREWHNQSHVRWYCRYHIVIVPKYRQKAIFGALSQITENRKVEPRKLLIFQHTIFRFCLQKATLRQNHTQSG